MPIPDDPKLSSQWHLLGGGRGRYDLDLRAVWDPADGPAYTGAGIRAVVIDDGFDYRHPDLAPNYLPDEDRDYPTDGSDAFGETWQPHGTAVSGIIGAAANGRGLVGVAYEVDLIGYRTSDQIGEPWLEDIRDAITDAALNGGDVANISQGIANDALSVFGNGYSQQRFRDIADALVTAVEEGRGGLGLTVVKAAGNSREASYDVAADDWGSDTHQVIVGAVNRQGSVSSYSSYGAALLVSAFGTPGYVVTTDRIGADGYWYGNAYPYFNGTSAATPMVTGVVALMLEAAPGLGWRDVQSILASSARHVGSTVGEAPDQAERFSWGWNGASTWNGGGQHFSNDYGYGLVDAHDAVRLAESWLLTGAAAATSGDEASAAVDLLDGVAAIDAVGGLNLDGLLDSELTVERVAVELSFSSESVGDLEIFLTSPDGTVSQLLESTGRQSGYSGTWSFESQAFRGESAAGTWSVHIVDSSGWTTADDLMVRVHGAAGEDDRYVFTDDFSAVAGVDGHATTLADVDGGSDTLNAAAVTGGCTIRLDGLTGSIDGVAVTVTGVEHAVGGDGADLLIGDAADNRLCGMRGDDTLAGAGGADRLIGGSGGDHFVFTALADSTPAERDVILRIDGVAFGRPGAGGGDRIVLTLVDADATVTGDQAFGLDDSGATGTLRCVDHGSVTRVLGYTDADPEADFRLDIRDGSVLAADYGAADFLL